MKFNPQIWRAHIWTQLQRLLLKPDEEQLPELDSVLQGKYSALIILPSHSEENRNSKWSVIKLNGQRRSWVQSDGEELSLTLPLIYVTTCSFLCCHHQDDWRNGKKRDASTFSSYLFALLPLRQIWNSIKDIFYLLIHWWHSILGKSLFSCV